jgi:hypothetical protein
LTPLTLFVAAVSFIQFVDSRLIEIVGWIFLYQFDIERVRLMTSMDYGITTLRAKKIKK